MDVEFGSSLRETRLQTGLTQTQMARVLGVTQPAVSGMERGRIPASRRVLARLAGLMQQPRTPGTAKLIDFDFDLPKRDPLVTIDSYRVDFWQRPEASGDFACVYPLPDKGILFVCGDMAGRGISVLPSRTFVQGWLSGYLANAAGTPRLANLINQLSSSLKVAGFQLSAYLVIITPAAGHSVNYEAACFAMPQPLLLMGPPYQTRISAEISPALPVQPHEVQLTRIDSLAAPWRLVASSDGLLQRIGLGNEQDGRLQIRKWMSGEDAATPLNQLLETELPARDDELCAVLEYSPWDLTANTTTTNLTERGSVFATIRQRLEGGGADCQRAEEFLQAVLEAMDNAARHAYPDRDGGPLGIRFREEANRWRVEVSDIGIGTASRAKPGGGLNIINHFSSHCIVGRNRGGGTVVTLLLDHPPRPTT